MREPQGYCKVRNKQSKNLERDDRSVHTSDDIDIGDVNVLSSDFVVVKRGYLHEHHYYIPMTKVEGWNGKVLWLRIPEEKVKENYERQIVPDLARYYVKNLESTYSAEFSELSKIPPKYKRPMRNATTNYTDGEQKYGCALCEMKFNTREIKQSRSDSALTSMTRQGLYISCSENVMILEVER